MINRVASYKNDTQVVTKLNYPSFLRCNTMVLIQYVAAFKIKLHLLKRQDITAITTLRIKLATLKDSAGKQKDKLNDSLFTLRS